MLITINNKEFTVPFDLSDITLQKFIEYYDQYGRGLDKDMEALQKKEYEGDDDDRELSKEMDLDTYLDNEALAWISFWTGHDLYEVQNEPFIIPVLSQYRLFRMLLIQSESNTLSFPSVIEWQNEQWSISDFKVNAASDMSFNEIITSKEVTRQIYQLGKGRWEVLPYLCAIYFRKQGEAFTDELIYEEGERLQLMQQLPMSIALQVAFFLSVCVSTWKSISAYSDDLAVAPVSLN